MKARFNYVELTVADTARSSTFYSAAFGMAFTDFGPGYAATTTGDTDIGLEADAGAKSPLPVIEVDDLAGAEAAVRAAGGLICVEPFAYPGGRRFQFKDPDGHELAVSQPD